MPLLGHSQRATHVTDLFFPAGIGMADESRAGTTFQPRGRTCDTLHFLQAVLPTQHCCSLPRESPAPHPEHLHFLAVISLCVVLTKHFCLHLGNSFYLIILTAQLHPPGAHGWSLLREQGLHQSRQHSLSSVASPAQAEDQGNEAPRWV